MIRYFVLSAVLLCALGASEAQSVFPFVDVASIPRFHSGPQNFPSDFETFKIPSSNKTLPQIYWEPLILDKSQNITGNLFRIPNPGHHISVLPPLEKQCGKRVPASINARAHGCRFACNAGFFNVQNGDCIGNLVTNTYTVQTSDIRVANFGVRDGHYVIGYVSPSDVSSAQPSFNQLVAGVGWLVRDGKNYLAEAVEQEHISNAFRVLLAPRIAVGHDKAGALLILEVNGYEPAGMGYTLDQMAAEALRVGAVNMINLDGGGSVSSVLDGRILNSCSDGCSATETIRCPAGFDGSVHCERTVTSIICIS